MKINPLLVLPNSFTAASMFLAIISIIFASRSIFDWACWLIIISMVLDGLDGRVARLTNTTSKFGIEFDSLADVVAFGVAPAMLMYFYVGQYLGRIGIAVSAIFVVFGAIRLARFNISTVVEPNNFIGLPIPGAAAFVVIWVLVNQKYELLNFASQPASLSLDSIIAESYSSNLYGYLVLIVMFIVGVLMVSNIRYPSFKKIKWNTKIFVALLVLMTMIFVRPTEVIAFIMTSYVLYGILRWILLLMKVKIRL